jgi:hypothetical protein
MLTVIFYLTNTLVIDIRMLYYFRKTIVNLALISYCTLAGFPKIKELGVESRLTFFIAAINFVYSSY